MLTFLVDPQHDDARRKGERVWAVVASPTVPTERAHAPEHPLLSLGTGWEDRLDELVRQVDAFRSS